VAPILTHCQPVRNEILASLPDGELRQLRPHLTRVRLVPGQVLTEHGQLTEHAFFIEEGIVSLVVDTATPRSSVQVAMIGKEGVVGGQALLGIDSGSFVSCVTQIPGHALRIPVVELRRLLEPSPELRALCMRAVEALMHQTMQTAASNARYTLAQRCIRWLLMAHERVEGDDLPITHEALSTMLGVRRSGITVVASGLQDAGFVRVSRGRITILDRPGLERQATGMPWTVDVVPGYGVQAAGGARSAVTMALRGEPMTAT
jgi:CRP-like cAMP-binding protein